MNLVDIRAEDWPLVVPIGWHRLTFEAAPVVLGPSRMLVFDDGKGLRILYSIATMADGKRFHHISFSINKRLPSWEEMRDSLYDVVPFLNKDKPCYMTLPPKGQYVTLINSHVMHWWQGIEGS
jgi:hypothetical protein